MASESSAETQVQERKHRLARRIRHIGYAVCGSIVIGLAVFLTYTVITGIQTGQVWDPNTHQIYRAQEEPAE